MELRLTYQEISTLIENHTGRSLPLSFGGPHTLRLDYEVNVLFKTASVGLDITVDQIVDSDIYLSYSGGAGIDFLVRQAIGMAKNRPGGELIECLDGNRILLRLSQSAQAGSLLERITLRDIRFDESYVIIDFSPRSL
ncbi:MAG: hypothetical protein IJU19_02930 [Bacteroidales bacterium]|nr:hypothetical protein [Bacteroidales bacterium]